MAVPDEEPRRFGRRPRTPDPEGPGVFTHENEISFTHYGKSGWSPLLQFGAPGVQNMWLTLTVLV